MMKTEGRCAMTTTAHWPPGARVDPQLVLPSEKALKPLRSALWLSVNARLSGAPPMFVIETTMEVELVLPMSPKFRNDGLATDTAVGYTQESATGRGTYAPMSP